MRSLAKNNQRGFTIVELLIVIVVIAVLAAITIVAYNGIQARARSSAGSTLASNIMKKAEAFNTLNNVYPSYCQLVTNSNTPTGSAPAAGTTGAGTCAAGGTTGGLEAKLDSVTMLTPAGSAAGANYTVAVSANGTVVGYYQCTAGVNIFWYDYGNSNTLMTDKAGAGC